METFPRSVPHGALGQWFTHSTHFGYEQLEAFPRPVSPETWQGESPQPLQHSHLRVSREVESTSSSGRAHMDYLSGQKQHLARVGTEHRMRDVNSSAHPETLQDRSTRHLRHSHQADWRGVAASPRSAPTRTRSSSPPFSPTKLVRCSSCL